MDTMEELKTKVDLSVAAVSKVKAKQENAKKAIKGVPPGGTTGDWRKRSRRNHGDAAAGNSRTNTVGHHHLGSSHPSS